MAHMPMEPEAFAEQVAGLLRRLQPEYAIAMVNPHELLVNGRRLDLDNLYRMVTNEPGRGQEIVEHFLDQLFTGDGLEMGDMHPPDESSEETTATSSSSSSLHDDYNRLYRLSPAEQQAARQAELGVRRYSTEGKACIECFRIARYFRSGYDDNRFGH